MIDRKQLEALARKNAAKKVPDKVVKRRKYDDTLPQDAEEGEDSKKLFEEMKKREF